MKEDSRLATGGTGKFGKISGQGSYKGKITPGGQTSEVSLDASY